MKDSTYDTDSRRFLGVRQSATAVVGSRYDHLLPLATLAIAALILLLINPSILGRAPEGDELALLRNLKVIEWSGAFFPLPLFDLASPPGATLSLKALAEITQYNSTAMRLVLLLANCTFLYWATCATKIVNKEIPFVLFCMCLPLVYYTTELKQYSFELIASYIMIITIVTTRNLWKLRLANVSALLLSFGAIIQVAAQTLIRAFGFLIDWRRYGPHSVHQRIVDLAVTSVILLLFVLVGKYLTQLQLTNYNDESFKNNGLIIDFLRLGKLFFLAHGPLLSITGLFAAIIAVRAFGFRAIAYHPLSVFFLISVSAIVILRLAGLYPAVYPRHIIWLVPVSIFVISIWLDKIFVAWPSKSLRAALLFGMAVAAVVMSRTPMERTSDYGLFDALAKLPPASDVVLNLGAQVALPLYEEKDSRLSRYEYHGWVNPKSAPTIPEEAAMENFAGNASQPGAFSAWTYFVLNHDFRPLWSYLLNSAPVSQFYIATSFQTPIGSPVLDDSAKAMVESMRDRGCAFTSLYAGNLVEILDVRCEPVTAPAPRSSDLQ